MLKLVFDVKCGFESIYLVEKGLEFPLDFLTDKKLFDENNKNLNLTYVDENTLYLRYVLNPQKFILDYKLFDVLRTVIGQEYFETCFKNFKKAGKVFFPELFILENVSLQPASQTTAIERSTNKINLDFADNDADTDAFNDESDFEDFLEDETKYDA